MVPKCRISLKVLSYGDALEGFQEPQPPDLGTPLWKPQSGWNLADQDGLPVHETNSKVTLSNGNVRI